MANALSLEEVLRQSGAAREHEDRDLPGFAMSLLPIPMPLAPPRDEYADVKFSTATNRALLIGKDLLEPQDLSSSEHYSAISKKLGEEHIEKFNSIQQCAWPHILRGRNCVIIGGTGPKKGKSYAYLAPIAYNSSQMVQAIRKGSKDAVGPVGLILCGTAKSCAKVSSALSKLLSGFRLDVFEVKEFEQSSKRNVKANTDFIITTVPSALDLFENYFETFQFQRLRYLVFDDTQISFKYHFTKVEELISKICKYRSKMERPVPAQVIFCGTDWNEKIASAAVNACNDAVIVIESSMAALRYGGIDFPVYFFTDPFKKLEQVSDICKAPDLPRRTIILCNEAESIQDIRIKLYRDTGITPDCLDNDDPEIALKIRQLKCLWHHPKPGRLIFVITDRILKELELRDVDHLIHYELPVGKKQAFADRHMCMWGHFPNVLEFTTKGSTALNSKVPLKSHVIITSHDNEMHKIVLKLHEIGVPIPDALFDYSTKKFRADLESKKICCDFKAFGRCIKIDPCHLRHHFSKKELEAEPVVPKLGRINLEILTILLPNVYTARLVSYYEVVNKQKVNHINYGGRANQLEKDLNSHYFSKENLIAVKNPKEGQMCVVEDQDGNFRRALINKPFSGNVPKFQVFCVDIGEHLLREPDKLYVLHSSLSVESKRQMTVTVYLAGIKPHGAEPDFPSGKTRLCMDAFQSKIYTGKIVLSVGNEIWVNSLIAHKRGTEGEWLQTCNVRLELKKSMKIGEDNPNHMELLYKCCEEITGHNYDHYRADSIIGNDLDNIFHPKGENVEWAFLPMFPPRGNESPTIEAWCTYYKSLSQIFIQRDDRTTPIDKLNEELDHEVSTMIDDKYAKYATIFEEYYDVGLPIAALDLVDKKWNRAMIVSKYEINGEVLFDIFYVDMGDSVSGMRMKDMFPLKKEFVTKLPFQAILIRSGHIAPLDTNFEHGDPAVDWKDNDDIEEVTGKLFISEDQAQKLDVSAIRKGERLIINEVELCRVYDAFILGKGQDNDVGELVVEKNLAKFIPGAKKELENWKATLLRYWNREVEKTLDLNDSEDDSEAGDMFDEDFDINFGSEASEQDRIKRAKAILVELGMAEEILETFQPKPAIEPSDKVVNSLAALSLTDEHAEVKPSEQPSTSNSKSFKKSKGTSRNKAPKSFANLLVPIGPQFKKPNVEWSHTPELIILWIHIPDLKKFEVDLDQTSSNDCLIFRSDDPAGYGFEISLVGKILPEIEKIPTGQYLTIKLKKLSSKYRWPYLVVGKPSFHWLKYKIDENMVEENLNSWDWDEDDSSDDEIEKEKIRTWVDKQSSDIEYRPDDDSDDDDEEVELSDEFFSDDDVAE